MVMVLCVAGNPDGLDSRNDRIGNGKEFLVSPQKPVDTPVAFERKQLLCEVATAWGKGGISATRTAKTRIFPFPAFMFPSWDADCSYSRNGV